VQIALIFQIGHHAANGGGADRKARFFEQGSRAHWLAIFYMAFHQGLQQDPGAL
jgi:hypothetical protein